MSVYRVDFAKIVQLCDWVPLGRVRLQWQTNVGASFNILFHKNNDEKLSYFDPVVASWTGISDKC